MKEKLAGFWESVKDFWSKTSRKMRILFLSVAAGILAVSLVVVLLLNRSDYITLYSDQSTAENAEIIAQLQEVGIEARLEGSKLMVPKDAEDKARMQLASKGYSNTGFDYETFERGSSLTATQSDKDRWAVNDLQDRLQATIKTFDEVSDAVVTISIPERNNFVLENDVTPTTASVKLQVKPGKSLSTEQIQGILNIVKNSVPGLEEENVSIADQSGDLLGYMALGRDAAATKLSLTEQVNETVKRRIMGMIGPVYGEGKVNVAVNSVLDTDQMVTESNTYLPLDPENPANNPLDYAEYAREKTGQGGFAEGVPGANDNIQTPEYLAEQQEINAADYYSVHDVYDYLVSSVKSQIIKEGLEITDMTVAVLIDAESLPNGERDQIIDLVASTAGVPNDKVSVQSIRFNTITAGETFDPPSSLRWVIIFTIIAIAALIIILVLVLLFLRRRQQQQLAAEGGMILEDGVTLVDLMGQEEEFEPISIPETSEQKLKAQIKDLAESDPEIVAQLIKTWLLGST